MSNTGERNSGHNNSGDRNSGYWNSGHNNSGNRNSGDYNSGDMNSGFFNTDTPQKIRCFNSDCDRDVWEKAEKPNFIYEILTEQWVSESNMTDKEKAENPDFHVRDGYLKTIPYKEAWKVAWDNASDSDKELLYKLPNFNAKIFEEITGIDTEVKTEELTVGEIEKLLGKKIKIIKE